MSQSYNKSCMFCKNEIEMSDRGAGKWLRYNLDGSTHERKNTNINTNTSTSTGTKKVETRPLSLEELEARLKRLEGIVIGAQK